MPTRPVPSYIQRPDYADHPLGKFCSAVSSYFQFMSLMTTAKEKSTFLVENFHCCISNIFFPR